MGTAVWPLFANAIKMKGEIFYFWRAVDQHGGVLDILMEKWRSGEAAKRFLNKLAATCGDNPKRVMQRFKSRPHAQRFCAAHDQINTLFRPHRHRLSKPSYRHGKALRWRQFVIPKKRFREKEKSC